MSMMTTDVLDMDYVALCVADKRSGGVYVRGLRPMSGYSDVDVPLAVLPYLKNVSLFDRDTGVYSGFPSSMFEITWMAKGKECRLIKTCLDNGYPSNSNVTKALLIAEATTIQAAQV
ncbi:hypothetical protein IWW45_003467 [Coemansia sp. RSA 485]|nr:hypothetical protein IWW45_003467 [Coemansia sp. RSA 485]